MADLNALPDRISILDWNEVWRVRMRQHRLSANFPDNLQHYHDEERARRYDSYNREKFGRRIEETLADLAPVSESRVLDIGSGPGTLAIPLSRKAREVCVVEPAAGMVTVLRKRLEKEGLSNVRVVPLSWEEVNIEDLSPPYDIVLAAFSLGMEDLRSAVQKMQEVACGTVNLYWFVDTPFWERICLDLWPDLHGSPYYPQPLVDTLYQVLYHMGIHANVQVKNLDKCYRFSSEKEMCAHFCPGLGASTTRQEALVERYLEGDIQRDRNGIFISAGSHYARVWWRVKKNHSSIAPLTPDIKGSGAGV